MSAGSDDKMNAAIALFQQKQEELRKKKPLPPEWAKVPSAGSAIHRIIPIKMPLDEEAAKELKMNPNDCYLLQNAIKMRASAKQKVGLIVNLAPSVYYDAFYTPGETVHIPVSTIMPSKAQTTRFCNIIHAFMTREKEGFVLVHDILSYNVTGVMICSYLIEKLNLSVEVALKKFKESRSPGIFDRSIVEQLYSRYEDEDGLKAFSQKFLANPDSLAYPSWHKKSKKRKSDGGFALPSAKRKATSRMKINAKAANAHQMDLQKMKIIKQKPLPHPLKQQKPLPHPLKKDARDTISTSAPRIEPDPVMLKHPFLQRVPEPEQSRLFIEVTNLCKNKKIFNRYVGAKCATLPFKVLQTLKSSHRITWLPKSIPLILYFSRKGAFLINMKSPQREVYHVPNLKCVFKNSPVQATIAAGELVIDIIEKPARKEISRFLFSDGIVFSKFDLTELPHHERMKPLEQHLRANPESPLRLRAKPYLEVSEESYSALDGIISSLPHQNSGIHVMSKKAPFGSSSMKIMDFATRKQDNASVKCTFSDFWSNKASPGKK